MKLFFDGIAKKNLKYYTRLTRQVFNYIFYSGVNLYIFRFSKDGVKFVLQPSVRFVRSIIKQISPQGNFSIITPA